MGTSAASQVLAEHEFQSFVDLVFDSITPATESASLARRRVESSVLGIRMEVSPRIPQKLFFRIGEVCELIKVQPHVLRYWETEFPMLAPQKNRAGQRIYRRRDVEMVLRIRDLLYEQKFTIAGAKKKLIDEMRSTSSRGKGAHREARRAAPARESVERPQPESTPLDPAPELEERVASQASLGPKAQRAIRAIKRELEALLTMLNSDASIPR